MSKCPNMSCLRFSTVNSIRQKTLLKPFISNPNLSLAGKRQTGTSSLTHCPRVPFLPPQSWTDSIKWSSLFRSEIHFDRFFKDRGNPVFHVPISVHTEITTSTATIDSVYHPKTGTWQYIIADPNTLDAVIIDPVIDFDAVTRTLTTATADRLVSLVKKKGYRVVRILETHVHTDHVTAAAYLQSVLGHHQAYRPAVCIGRRIRDAQQFLGPRYGVPGAEMSSAFDRLLEDDEVFSIGELEARVMHLPGHTADHVVYIIGENVFCGHSVLNADLGTARCDFPGGSSKTLYESTRKLLGLPSCYKLWTGHDDPKAAGRRCPVPYMSVGEQRQSNCHVHEHVTEQTFQKIRDERDASLQDPELLHASLQINMRGGRLPKTTLMGEYYLRLP